MKNKIRLQDMLEAIESIEVYQLSNYEKLVSDDKTQDAIMFNLVILGEAANQITDQFQEEHPEIPWASMIGTRNIIVHGYDQIRLPIVWEIITKDLPILKEQIRSALSS